MGDGKINGWLDLFCMNRLVGGWMELYGLREKAVEFSQRLESMHTHSQYSTTQNALSLANILPLPVQVFPSPPRLECVLPTRLSIATLQLIGRVHVFSPCLSFLLSKMEMKRAPP